MVPLSMHKVFESCGIVLLAHRLFFITDVNRCTTYIISDQLSETRINRDRDRFNPESIIGTFSFENRKEVIRALYKVTKFNNVISRKVSEEIENKCILPKNVKDVKIEPLNLDTCIIVTNRCVYEVVLRSVSILLFMKETFVRDESIDKLLFSFPHDLLYKHFYMSYFFVRKFLFAIQQRFIF